MPYVQALPTWGALNGVNSTSPTGITDPITGQIVAAGGLNLGDYFDITNEQAAQVSNTSTGILYAGRYRFVQVDSGATAANVKTGTVGYLRNGQQVKSVVILTAGSGQTAGTYTVNANVGSGGGAGAVIQVIVGSGGTVTSVSVLSGGYNYSSVPTFTLVTGGTVGTVVAQLGTSMNVVTSADQLTVTGILARPVVFLNSITPGNYGFIQELGVATVLAAATFTQTAAQYAIAVSSSPTGLMTTSSATSSIYAIGNVLDPITSPLVNTPFKVLLNLPVVQD